ncbi:Ankyrin repeat-containing protein [Artemisia annua]|uniref:Ankyrin repeat-containing protein n=1 Tax=Artemisia annua TaxID=35608 RepID=A0A2U1MWJ6_ARTAN|nr:Ankyrin repeat-containing protein [Artemisia annua]
MASTSGMTPELEQQHEPTDESINASGPDPGQEIRPEPTRVLQTEIVPAEPEPEPQLEQEEVRPQEPAPQPGPEHAPEQAVPLAQLNLPLPDLLNNDRRDFVDICVPLYEASIKGDWATAAGILQQYSDRVPNLLGCSITDNNETALHVAASAQRNKFVRSLLTEMTVGEMEYQNNQGNTALCLAAITGNVGIAELMLLKNKRLLTIRDAITMTPLYLAATYGKRDMVMYLYSQMDSDERTHENIKWVSTRCVEADIFDIPLKIFADHPECAQTEVQSILGVLAFNCSLPRPVAPHESEALKLLRGVLESIEERPKDEINTILRGPRTSQGPVIGYSSQVLFVAAELGNTNFIVELIRKFPDLVWKTNDDGLSIFHIAVSRRHLDIYNLLHELGSMKESIINLTDPEGNNMLHLVGKMADKNQFQDVPGAAFRMQRELLWYKEVESKLPPSCREWKNNSGQTPHELFTETNMDLISESQKWMRGTAGKCMLVASLVATIVFNVEYKTPGGIKPDIQDIPFLVFVVLDAISLILSATSILVLLSILTSRYTEEDLIESLPKKLMVGLSMLFFSILTMMIAFSVSFYVTYNGKLIILAGCISLVALMPAFAYVKLQYPLIKDVIRSTYGSRYLFKPKKKFLYD